MGLVFAGLMILPVAAWGAVLGVRFAAAALESQLSVSHGSIETNAVGTCRTYGMAQTIYKRYDWDGDGKLAYAPQPALLHSTLDASGESIDLMDVAFAAAATVPEVPEYGYIYREMNTIAGEPIDWEKDFALCATPVIYGRTGDCNLRCSYCYAGAKSARVMPEALGRRAIDRAVASVAPGGRLERGFFGGEPLLESALVLRLLGHARERCRGLGLDLAPGLTTNGTLAMGDAWRLLTHPGDRPGGQLRRASARSRPAPPLRRRPGQLGRGAVHPAPAARGGPLLLGRRGGPLVSPKDRRAEGRFPSGPDRSDRR